MNPACRAVATGAWVCPCAGRVTFEGITLENRIRSNQILVKEVFELASP
jgi:hypothetical protein